MHMVLGSPDIVNMARQKEQKIASTRHSLQKKLEDNSPFNLNK